MTARKSRAKASDPAARTPLEVEMQKDDTKRQAFARKFTGPNARHALVVDEALSRLMDRFDTPDKPGLVEYSHAIKERAQKASSGDTVATSELLMAQAVSLDHIFTEYARMALVNIVNHLDASERLMRLALKAQANSRANLEALSRLHQPREQTVRHVHVNDGGQAVITDQFHNHAGGHQNAETVEQPHAARAAGSGPALPSANEIGRALPVTGDQGSEAMPYARGQGKRRTKG